jgi:hypothetical protein
LAFDAELHIPFEKGWRGKESAHMRIEVSRMESHPHGAIELSAYFAVDLIGLRVTDDFGDRSPECAFRVDQARNAGRSRQRSPAVVVPLRSEREMEAGVGPSVCLDLTNDVRDPGCRHHDAK